MEFDGKIDDNFTQLAENGDFFLVRDKPHFDG